MLDRDGFIAFCPYASLQPCEVWLMPTVHEPWFEQRARAAGVDALAEILHRLSGADRSGVAAAGVQSAGAHLAVAG